MLADAFVLKKENRDWIDTQRYNIRLLALPWLFFGAVLLGVATLNFDTVVYEFDRIHALTTQGVTRSYTVTDVDRERDWLGTYYEIDYRFDADDTFSSRGSLHTRQNLNLVQGDTVRLQTDLEPQFFVYPPLPTADLFPLHWGALPVESLLRLFGFAIVGAAMLGIGLRQLYHYYRLTTQGTVIPATITHVTRMRRAAELVYTVRYEFTSPQTGDTRTGKGIHLRRELEYRPLPDEGMSVAVLYVNDGLHRAL